MSVKEILIGTRGSELALAQANEVRQRMIDTHGSDLKIDIEIISTMGDRVTDRPLSEIGGKGLFTQEIEERLLDGRIDMAVHSTKDMPTVLPEGLELSRYLPREAPEDGFISKKYKSLQDLPQGAVVGSSSLRRKALILRLRPDLQVVNFRGNVQTRLRKLEEEQVDATLLAVAGLNRLGLADIITSSLGVEEFPPAPGQGAICVETKIGDDQIENLLSPINHAETQTTLAAERAFLKLLDGSCRTPIAGHAILKDGQIDFYGMILTPEGDTFHETRMTGPAIDAQLIGENAAKELRDMAGDQFFEDWNSSS